MRSDRRKQLCHLLNAMAPAVVALAILSAAPSVFANDLWLGKAAPPATLVTLDGQRITTSDLRGHTVILTFWATWCAPCREEMPLLSHYAEAHRDQGLMVLGFSLDDAETIDKVRAIAKQTRFPVGLLAASSAPGYGRMWRIPVSFVIDRDGMLRYDGWKAAQPVMTEASLHQVVDPLLTSP
jgi:peroxiredoxin